MNKSARVTSNAIASRASKVLSSPSSSAVVKSLAASALSQRTPSHQTSAQMEDLASRVLNSAKYNETTHSLAGSVLSQSNKAR